MIFLDYIHEACNGEGCEECHGSGMVGEIISSSEAPVVAKQRLDLLPFALDMQAARREPRITLRELSTATGIQASRLSEIEHAQLEPTVKEKIRIFKELAASWPEE